MDRGLSGERIEKILYIIFVMKYFFKSLIIHLGIVVSALAFHAGDPGSIPWLGKSTFSPPSSPVSIIKPSSLD